MVTRIQTRGSEPYVATPRRAWSIENPGNRAARTELLRAIAAAVADEIRGARSILDVGCGTGWLLEALSAAGVDESRLFGVDLAAERVAAARSRVPGPRIRAADARALPYPNANFGTVLFVVALSSLQSHDDVRAALREGKRVLAPGGVLVVYEPRVPNPMNSATRLVRRSDLDSAGVSTASASTLTLLPALGRRLGRTTSALHPLLSRVPPLRTHRLYVHRSPL